MQSWNTSTVSQRVPHISILSKTSCNPDAIVTESMQSPDYKFCLPMSRHAAVCTMHERPWCLWTILPVSQGHWGIQRVPAQTDLTGEGANITDRVIILPAVHCHPKFRYSRDTNGPECTAWPLLPAQDVVCTPGEVAEEKLMLYYHLWDLSEHNTLEPPAFSGPPWVAWVDHGSSYSLSKEIYSSYKAQFL